jgi:hypothetical protein
MMNNTTENTVQVAKEKTQWFFNGELHRADGPAVEYNNGDKAWFLNGRRHRTDGPAIEYNNGDKIWYLNGELHRADGPAVKWSDGHKIWYLNGKPHRADGPAVEWSNGRLWYLNGVEVTEQAVMKPVKEMTVVEIEAMLGCSIKIIVG